MFTHQKRLILLFLFAFLITGCVGQKQKEDFSVYAKQMDYIDDTLMQNQNMGETANVTEMMFSAGVKIKALSDVPGIDDPAILVNGISITKREIETQSILDNVQGSFPLKETIDILIRTRAMQAEAIILGIEPSQDKIDNFLEHTKRGFGSDAEGGEEIYGYLKGMEITMEEYLTTLEEVVYVMFQCEDLWASVEPSRKFKSYEEYIDTLVAKANIEILDPEIKKLFSNK